MRAIIHLILLLRFLSIQNMYAQTPQNLIQNPSFEESADYVPCGGAGLMTRFHNGASVFGWSTSTNGSPDYYGTCSQLWSHTSPKNWKGYQPSIDGNHYIGAGFVFSETYNWKRFHEETVQGTLIEPLQPNQGYCFSFYYAIGDNEYNNCTVDTLRFYFADTDTFFLSQITDSIYIGQWSYHVSNSGDLYGKHQIEIPVGHITDTANWHFMNSHFKAKGGEKFMIGGVFKDNAFVKYKESVIDSFYVNGIKSFPDSIAYLYFDMFSLYECDEYGLGDHKIRLPNIFTPNGDGINDSYFIHDYLPPGFLFRVYNRWGKEIYRNDNYQNDWSPNNISDGTYWVVVKNPDSGTEMRQVLTIISSK